MPTGNLSNATTTDYSNSVPDFIVEAKSLDTTESGETYVYFDKATENFGYYFNHPQVASPINSLCTWAFGQGYTTEDTLTEVILSKIDGNGSENIHNIIWNHEATKLINGDAFCQIIRNKNGTLINLINISPERVKVVYRGNRIKRYEIWNGNKWIKKKPSQILHSSNSRS